MLKFPQNKHWGLELKFWSSKKSNSKQLPLICKNACELLRVALSAFFEWQMTVSTEANELWRCERSPQVTFAVSSRAFPEILSPLFSWFLITADICSSRVSSCCDVVTASRSFPHFRQFTSWKQSAFVCSLSKLVIWMEGDAMFEVHFISRLWLRWCHVMSITDMELSATHESRHKWVDELVCLS